MENSKNKQQNINDAALEYMEQKYGEKFEYVAPWGSSYTTPGMRQILVSCASLPQKEILVVIKSDNNKESYADNYMDFYFETQTVNFLKRIADDFFENTTVELNIARSPSSDYLFDSVVFEDYIENTNIAVNGNLIVESLDEMTVESFVEKLKSSGVHFSLSITNVSANDGYSVQFFNDDTEPFIERRKP